MNKALTKDTIDRVKTTIPFIAENSQKLTEHFYKRMFAGNPEVKSFFNTSNQQSGAQQRALAGAICAFAQNMETPEKLADAVSRIGNKHASLGIQPEHYPVVGEHLLGSIDDLLNPAPKEILSAWGEAYNFLADILIGTERSLYAEQARVEAGWNGFKRMIVFKREHESQWITSFYLKPVDGGKLPAFKPGQYITVRIPTADGSTTMRNYSLSGDVDWDYYRISVKREVPRHADTPEGYASSYLHTQIGVGDSVELGPPCGEFFLKEHNTDTPVLLLSGGVGITPLLAMLHQVRINPVTFLHGAINGEQHAFREEVNKLERENTNITAHFRYSAPTREDEQNQNHHSTGLFTVEFLQEFVTAETEVYFCGPKPMMRHVYRALATMNHPMDKVHYEFFGPQEDLES